MSGTCDRCGDVRAVMNERPNGQKVCTDCVFVEVTRPTATRSALQDETIYLGDNGRATCGEHAGMTAQATGRDLSGQKMLPVTPEAARECERLYGYVPECEECGRVASLLVLTEAR